MKHSKVGGLDFAGHCLLCEVPWLVYGLCSKLLTEVLSWSILVSIEETSDGVGGNGKGGEE